MCKSERLVTLLDAVQIFIAEAFGPDEIPAVIRIDGRSGTPSVKVVTDHGGRVTIDTLRSPGIN